MALSETMMEQVKTSISAQDPQDNAEWMYCYDHAGRIIAGFRGLNLTVTLTRKAYNVAAAIADVATVIVYHGRAQANHQLRIAAFHIPTGEVAGAVLRNGDEVIWSDPSRKDVELLQALTKKRGGA